MALAGRVALVTGGSRGLGLAMARELGLHGCSVVLLARDAQELRRAREDVVARTYATVRTIVCDVTERAEVERAVSQVIDELGSIDLLINNAGVIQVGPLEHMTAEDFEQALAVHVWGPLYATLAAVPHMRAQGGGRIVNISSIGGKVAVPHMLPYVTSKFALVGLSRGLRAALARDGIHVTTVCPGLMRTGSQTHAQFKGHHDEELRWFTLAAALPVSSMDAERAARKIVAAARDGLPEVTLSWQARALAGASAVAPGLTAWALTAVQDLLPGPSGPWRAGAGSGAAAHPVRVHDPHRPRRPPQQRSGRTALVSSFSAR
jgi:NAD(P)-dependent dehydrogenase (short-subunit alcohol dehydrogenase family)